MSVCQKAVWERVEEGGEPETGQHHDHENQDGSRDPFRHTRSMRATVRLHRLSVLRLFRDKRTQKPLNPVQPVISDFRIYDYEDL